MEFSIYNFYTMTKVLLIALLVLAAYSASDCDLGQIRVNNECVPLNFVEGCAAYRFDNECDVCEFGYDKDIDGTCTKNDKFNNTQCCA